jgi:hypothetical protein
MTRFRAIRGAVPLLLLGLVAGCGDVAGRYSDEGLVPTGGAELTAGPALKEVASEGTGTINGTVTFDGEPPVMGEVPGLRAHADAGVCLQGPFIEQTWVVDSAGKGVENVVVWVMPPKGQFFKKPENEFWRAAVEVDQPHCAFEPHVEVIYPQYFDGKEMQETGQKFTVVNSAPIAHNIRVAGSSQLNPARGGTLPPKTGKYEFNPKVDKQELAMNCDIHKFMTGFVMTFDHPYAAKTDKTGKFTIQNVPAGADLTIMAWHEAKKKFVPAIDGGNKVKLEKGASKEASFKISK